MRQRSKVGPAATSRHVEKPGRTLDAAALPKHNESNPKNKNRFTGGHSRQFEETRPMAISLKVNGVTRSVNAEPDTPLLYVLRNDFELNGAKYGCGMAQCGACTVLINGVAMRSCVMSVRHLGQAEVTTLDGLGTIEKLHP